MAVWCKLYVNLSLTSFTCRERRLTAVLAAIPTISQDGDNCAEQDLQQNQDLESLSLQSDSTVMHPNDLDDEISRTAADDSECSEGADLDAKAYLGNNPYALVDEQVTTCVVMSECGTQLTRLLSGHRMW